MSSKASLIDQIRKSSAILFPLIFTSMDRIDTVSNAMELRGFGKYRKRTWYSARALKRNDYIVLIVTVLFTIAALMISFHNGSRFYNPFAVWKNICQCKKNVSYMRKYHIACVFFMIKIKNTNKNIGCTILDISILCAIIQSNIWIIVHMKYCNRLKLQI